MYSPNGENLLDAFSKVIDFYFATVDKETILSISGAKKGEFNLKNLMNVAKEANLYAEIQHISIEEVEPFMIPLLMFDDKGNIVTLIKDNKNEVTIYDPKTKTDQTITKEKLKDFNKALLFFKKEEKNVLSSQTKELDWFFNPIKASWRAYVEVGILSVFINILALAMPLFTMNVYNRIVPNFATDTLFVLVGGIAIIFLFEVALKMARVYILEDTAKKVGAFLEEELLKRIISVRSRYDTLLAGTKANLFRELAQVKEFFTSRTLVQLLDLPFFFIAIVVIYIIDPVLAFVPFIGGIILVVFNILMQLPLAKMAHKQFKKAQTKHGYLVETIAGKDAIKLVNAHTHRLFTWSRVVAFYERLSHKIQLMQHFVTNVSYTIIQVITIVVVSVGVYQIHAKELSVGGLIAITILSSRAMVPIVNISNVLLHYKKMKDSLRSINEFWHLPQELHTKVQLGLGKLKGDIHFDHVNYTYPAAQHPSLVDLTLSIKPGEKVGIIGPTGAGKSTMLRLLTLLDTPTKGHIYIDGIDISTIHPIELRRHIGIMSQDPFLFSGTLAENIALSRSISKEYIAHLVKQTGLEKLIKQSGSGLEMEVGENGERLSTGQRHLVALARALVDDPSILILDEPTNGLDIGLENEIIKNLTPIVQSKTLLLVTHRYSALKLVDRVIVVKEGRVILDGKRDEVLSILQGKKQ